MASKKQSSDRRRSRPIEPKKVKLNSTVLIAIVGIIIILAIALFFIIGSDTGTYTGGNPVAKIDTSLGVIKVELFQDKVPNTVDNFISYANDNFYSGLVFHRVIDDFMIQGGGFHPDGSRKGTNDPIDLEIHEDVRNVDGAIAMARTNDPNSATSQFYICDGDQAFLDDNYAAFGIVIEGMEVVRSIASVDTTIKNDMSDWPVNDVIINSITIE